MLAGLPITGIMLNLSLSSLGQYTVCMDVPYSDVTTQAKLAACATDPNQYVAVGARQAGSSTLAVVAVARASEAFAQHCDARLANGAYWYNCVNSGQLSFGFAPSWSISLANPDGSSEQCEYRLSWLLDYWGGWRVGCTTNLESDSSYYKQIYILTGEDHPPTDLVQAPPSILQIPSSCWFCLLCASLRYVLIMTVQCLFPIPSPFTHPAMTSASLLLFLSFSISFSLTHSIMF